jgi:uncharacterized protein (TIGR02118 family)
MVKAVVLYGPPEDPDAFERYYAETHTALATAIPGLKRFEAAQGIATPDGGEGPLPAHRRAHIRRHGRAAGGSRIRAGGCG